MCATHGNQTSHVSVEKHPVHHTADETHRSRVAHLINHPRAAVLGNERMEMPPGLEWTIDLLIDESTWPLVLGDSGRHVKRESEVAGPPGDRLSLSEKTRPDCAHRFLT